MKSAESKLHIVARITPKPDCYAEGLSAIRKILAPTWKEAGCIQFDVFEDRENGEYVLIEIFESEAALQFHYQQTYTKQVFQLYERILEQPPAVSRLVPVKSA